jgi:hypothetical protein
MSTKEVLRRVFNVTEISLVIGMGIVVNLAIIALMPV